jgi:hypothetical protein
MEKTYPGAVDPTMDRFHLLFLAPCLIGLAWVLCRKRERRQLLVTTSLALLLTLLALGSNSIIPIREWLARSLFLYRAGRFPAGEHRGFALFAWALVMAVGLERLQDHVRSTRIRQGLIALLCIDFLLVMAATVHVRFMRLPLNLQGYVASFRVRYLPQDQALIDTPRGCPFDPRNEFDQRLTPPDRFSWNGYTNLFSKHYMQERNEVKDLLCGPSRLWDLKTHRALPYHLVEYTPSRIVFDVPSNALESKPELLWADVNDGYWKLWVNGKKQNFRDAPAGLRGIPLDLASQSLHVEMIYEGPLSRFWRHL